MPSVVPSSPPTAMAPSPFGRRSQEADSVSGDLIREIVFAIALSIHIEAGAMQPTPKRNHLVIGYGYNREAQIRQLQVNDSKRAARWQEDAGAKNPVSH